jgi:hypothetical protein
MKSGFIPISQQEYVELHLRSNPDTDRNNLEKRLRHAIESHERGIRCRCGEEIWIIGSAEVGLSCFTCITGEATPDDDYEIAAAASRPTMPSSGRRAKRGGASR